LGDRRIYSILFGIVLLLVIPLSIDGTVFADDDDERDDNTRHYDDDDDERDDDTRHYDDERDDDTRLCDDDDDDEYDEDQKRISLKDLGVLQLAAHDLFNVDRGDRMDAGTATDFENGELDLSTLFVDTTTGSSPFDIDTIKIGGEIRNRENIMLFSVASHLGEKYAGFIEDGDSIDDAKEKTIMKYHKMLKKTYEKTFDEKFPEKRDGDVTFTENLAFRTVHDFLPGEILLDGISTPVLSIPPLTPLTKAELKQPSSPLDGTFDCEFRHIEISHPGGPTIIVDLLEADSSFADQFDTKFSFEFFLEELEDGEYDKKDKVMKQIRKLIGKGLKF